MKNRNLNEILTQAADVITTDAMVKFIDGMTMDEAKMVEKAGVTLEVMFSNYMAALLRGEVD